MTAVDTTRVEPAYRPFAVQVARVAQLGPSFRRVTFTGVDLDQFAAGGADQRVKVLLPLPGTGLADCPTGADWYADWRALPPERRNPMRTYTLRAARRLEREVDIDFVLHGSTGPASAWAERALPGDEVVLVGPNARFRGPRGGVEWRAPPRAPARPLGGGAGAPPAARAPPGGAPPRARGRGLPPGAAPRAGPPPP